VPTHFPSKREQHMWKKTTAGLGISGVHKIGCTSADRRRRRLQWERMANPAECWPNYSRDRRGGGGMNLLIERTPLTHTHRGRPTERATRRTSRRANQHTRTPPTDPSPDRREFYSMRFIEIVNPLVP
jgi:hypothetical protein